MVTRLAADDFEDGVKKLHEVLAAKYHAEYVLHVADCPSRDRAETFLRQLTFVSGNTLEEFGAPTNISLAALPFRGGSFMVTVGGQLTSDQNYSVRRLAGEMQIQCKSMCIASDNTLVQREFLTAARRIQEEGAQRERRRWWQIWK